MSLVLTDPSLIQMPLPEPASDPWEVLSALIRSLDDRRPYPCGCSRRARCDCSFCSCQDPWIPTIGEIIVHVNDNHKWTREEIADWLETLDLDLVFPTPEVINGD